MENRREEQVLSKGMGNSGKEGEMRKGCRRENIVQVMYTHVCKWKNETS
jgi:hypothetical protein